MHAGVMLTAGLGYPATWALLAFMGAVAVSWGLARDGLRSAATGHAGLLVTADGRWFLVDAGGEHHAAHCLPDAFVAPWLVVVRLRSPGRPDVRLYLARDNVPVQALRRLRVRLRLARTRAPTGLTADGA